jgi:hypothetical protein
MPRLVLTLILALSLPAPAVAAGPVSVPDAPAVSARARDAVRPVREAIAAEEAALKALPPPASDAERLVRLGRLDQAARAALYDLDLSRLDGAGRGAALGLAWGWVEAVDRRNQAALRALLPRDGGWFTRSSVGDEAAEAAWLVVIHAVRDRRLMREALRRMSPLVGTGEIEAGWYAGLYDRLAVLEGRPQRYGTQPVCRRGQWTAGEVEDPDGLEARRAALGLEAPDTRDWRPPPGCG